MHSSPPSFSKCDSAAELGQIVASFSLGVYAALPPPIATTCAAHRLSSMKLSIVTSLYRSAPYIAEFHQRIQAVAGEITAHCEFIYVNDGSPDDALPIALRIRKEDERVVVVDLSRNFGHHRALMVGLSYASGDLVFMIDVDLEEEPELLRAFYVRYLETEADSIYGVQVGRKGNAFERVSGRVFYSLVNFLSDESAPGNTLIARLMTRRFAKSLLLHQEHEMDIASLLHMTGYQQVPVMVRKHAKPDTTYTLLKKLTLALRSVTSYSRRPLIVISALGALILLITTVIMAYFLLVYLVSGEVPSGYTSLILSLWFLGGLSIFSIGIVALYIAIIFNEVKARPTAIVRDVYSSTKQEVPYARPRSR
jgi:putative glycosyltransferase